MKSFKTLASITIAALLVMSMSLGAATAASAAETAQAATTVSREGEPVITPELIADAIDALDAAGYSYTEGEGARTYDLGQDRYLSLPTDPQGGVSPRLGGGVLADGSGVYLDLNRTDQAALVNGGSAALAAVLCLVAVPVCIIAGIVIAVAVTYINDLGFCPKTLRIEADWNGALKRGYCI